jgi:leader peptidase (prepilin peptidase)/N-methyltransferase
VAQLALASLASGDWAALRRAAIAGLVLWVVYLALAVLAALLGSGFGLGDVTLAGLVGLATGYVSVTATLLASLRAFLLAGVYGVARIVARRGHAQGRHRLRPVDAGRHLSRFVVDVGPLL